jgi:hypothetical protein
LSDTQGASALGGVLGMPKWQAGESLRSLTLPARQGAGDLTGWDAPFFPGKSRQSVICIWQTGWEATTNQSKYESRKHESMKTRKIYLVFCSCFRFFVFS